jgi:hypothetical protein
MGKATDNEHLKLSANRYNNLAVGLLLGGAFIPYLAFMRHGLPHFVHGWLHGSFQFSDLRPYLLPLGGSLARSSPQVFLFGWPTAKSNNSKIDLLIDRRPTLPPCRVPAARSRGQLRLSLHGSSRQPEDDLAVTQQTRGT